MRYINRLGGIHEGEKRVAARSSEDFQIFRPGLLKFPQFSLHPPKSLHQIQYKTPSPVRDL